MIFQFLKYQRVAEADARLPAGEFRNRLFPINGALILRGRTGEASDRTRPSRTGIFIGVRRPPTPWPRPPGG